MANVLFLNINLHKIIWTLNTACLFQTQAKYLHPCRQRSNIISKLTDIINDDHIERLEKVLNQRTHYLTVVLDDIYIAQNASAVIRTCECVSIQDLHIIEERNKHKTNRDVVKGSSKWIELQQKISIAH